MGNESSGGAAGPSHHGLAKGAAGHPARWGLSCCLCPPASAPSPPARRPGFPAPPHLRASEQQHPQQEGRLPQQQHPELRRRHRARPGRRRRHQHWVELQGGPGEGGGALAGGGLRRLEVHTQRAHAIRNLTRPPCTAVGGSTWLGNPSQQPPPRETAPPRARSSSRARRAPPDRRCSPRCRAGAAGTWRCGREARPRAPAAAAAPRTARRCRRPAGWSSRCSGRGSQSWSCIGSRSSGCLRWSRSPRSWCPSPSGTARVAPAGFGGGRGVGKAGRRSAQVPGCGAARK